MASVAYLERKRDSAAKSADAGRRCAASASARARIPERLFIPIRAPRGADVAPGGDNVVAVEGSARCGTIFPWKAMRRPAPWSTRPVFSRGRVVRGPYLIRDPADVLR
jgi:hypothetical protein